MDELIRSLGVPAMVVILVLREVREILARKAPTSRDSSEHREMARKLDDLHRWHQVEDEDGVKRWYSPKHLLERLDKSDRTIDRIKLTNAA